MKINEIINMLPSLVAGVILGIIFFGGLWLTILKGLRSKDLPCYLPAALL